MLVWHGENWLIDHGASLYFHHSWSDHRKAAMSPFPYVKDHMLLTKAADLEAADAKAHQLLSAKLLNDIVALIPDEWLQWEGMDAPADEIRGVYADFLTTRFANSKIFVNHAIEARKALV